MALTYSSMLELGSNLEEFNLLNVVDGDNLSSDDLDKAKPSLIMFICNHCPYVIHYHDEIKSLANDFDNTINMVAISSNDINEYPQDGPDKMRELWLELGLSFPYLFDSTQDVAKHALNWYENNNNKTRYTLIVYPTAILLQHTDLLHAYDFMKKK